MKQSLWPLRVGVRGHPTPRAWLGLWVQVRKGVPVVAVAGAPRVVRKAPEPGGVGRVLSALEEA